MSKMFFLFFTPKSKTTSCNHLQLLQFTRPFINWVNTNWASPPLYGQMLRGPVHISCPLINLSWKIDLGRTDKLSTGCFGILPYKYILPSIEQRGVHSGETDKKNPKESYQMQQNLRPEVLKSIFKKVVNQLCHKVWKKPDLHIKSSPVKCLSVTDDFLCFFN